MQTNVQHNKSIMNKSNLLISQSLSLTLNETMYGNLLYLHKLTFICEQIEVHNMYIGTYIDGVCYLGI